METFMPARSLNVTAFNLFIRLLHQKQQDEDACFPAGVDASATTQTQSQVHSHIQTPTEANVQA